MSNHAQSRVPRRLGTVSIAAAALTIAACGSSSDSSVADTSTPGGRRSLHGRRFVHRSVDRCGVDRAGQRRFGQ